MTSTVVVSNPYMSVHEVVLHVEEEKGGTWVRQPTIPLPANSTAEPIVIDAKKRIVVKEATAEPKRG